MCVCVCVRASVRVRREGVRRKGGCVRREGSEEGVRGWEDSEEGMCVREGGGREAGGREGYEEGGSVECRNRGVGRVDRQGRDKRIGWCTSEQWVLDI